MTSSLLEATPLSARIRDMTLRDGLQSIPGIVPTEQKLQIYDALVNAGIRDLQVTSFMNPARLPQTADSEEVWRALADRPERRSVLVGNMRGFDRAAAAGARDIEAVVSASETYNRKNVGRTVRQSIEEIAGMAQKSREAAATVSVGFANCFHCAFEGRIAEAKVLDLIGELRAFGIREIGLSDTTGYATPDQVFALASKARAAFPDMTYGAHLHDTRGRGLANAVAALIAGISWFDAALAGLGGSPFAPGMGGNLSLEALADTLAEMGVETGIDVDRIVRAGSLVAEIVRNAAPISTRS